jgi:hypothetical protein
MGWKPVTVSAALATSFALLPGLPYEEPNPFWLCLDLCYALV